MKDLCELLSERVKKLGVDNFIVNCTRLKEKLCKHIPNLESYTKSHKNILLAFKSDIGQALADACANKFDEDALCLARAAEIVRRDLFVESKSFEGRFNDESEQNSIPSSLSTLVQLILEGPSIKHQTSTASKHSALSISQLIKLH